MSSPSEDLDKTIGQRIKQLRHERRLSQSKLAEAIGVTYQQVQRYESADNNISVERLRKIARVLNVPPAAFFDGVAP